MGRQRLYWTKLFQPWQKLGKMIRQWQRMLGGQSFCRTEPCWQKTKQVEDDLIFHTKIIPILGRTKYNGADACEWVPPRRSMWSSGNLETKKSPIFLDTVANFNSPLTFFGLSMSTMSIWLQSILVRFKFPAYFYVFPNDLKWLQNSRFWMETTTFMVTKAKRGIYQLFNFSLCGQLFII